MTFFVCRLIAPRPTFPFDMTEAERELMGRHAAYLHRYAEEGKALLFGPVADPKGPWGLGIFEVEDEETMRAIAAADPVVLADAGFSYEILPMMQAALGKRIRPGV
jgi:uncharacterized protein YciI